MFEDLPSLCPATFFRLEGQLHHASEFIAKRGLKSPYLLPDTSELLSEDAFADVGLGWNEKALFCTVRVNKPFEESFFPDCVKGDSVELFIDTRNLRTASVTRFCHHFVFFPKDPPQEITKFRLEDSRPLADPDDLILDVQFGKKHYLLDIVISCDALHGYDPLDNPKITFTYRINRYRGDPQHFNLSSHEYDIEKHPSLWTEFSIKGNV